MSVSHKSGMIYAACLTLALAACSGGSSGTSSTDDSSGGSGTTTVTSASLQSVNNLPDFNIDSLDAATSANVSANLSRNTVDDSDQEFSEAGCELRSHVEEFKFQIQELRSNVCIVKKMESEAGMEVGVDEYKYYEMQFEAGEAPGEDVEGGSADFGFGARVKIGVIDDTLHMALCTNESTGSEYVQTMAMTFGVTDGQFDGIIKNLQPSNSGATEPEGAFSIEALLATDDPEEFSDGDEAAFLAQMASNMWGAGHVGLDITKVGDALHNTVDAAFQSGNSGSEWGTWTSQAFGIYDSGEGCGTFSSVGTFAAITAADAFDEGTLTILFQETGIEGSDQICWTNPAEGECEDEDGCSIGDFVAEAVDGMCSFEQEGTECFSFELDSGTLGYFVLDPENAAYYEDVSAHEGLDEFVTPTIEFAGDEVWDCEDEADNEFVAIDPSAAEVQAAFETCFALASDDSRSIESCYEQDTQAGAEHDSGVDVHDEAQEFGESDGSDDEGTGDEGDNIGGTGEEGI